MELKNLIFIPAITALLIIIVLITPPIIVGGIPFSLQPLFIALIAFMFDWKTTLSIVCLYLLIGFLGLPVFSGGKNGISAISSGTLGFIIGFIPYALILNFSRSFSKIKIPILKGILLLLTSLLSLSCLYIGGLYTLHITLGFSISKFITVMSPLFVMDILKIAIALTLSLNLQPLIHYIQKT